MPGQAPHMCTRCGAKGWRRCHTCVATGSRGRRPPAREHVDPPSCPQPELCVHDRGAAAPWTLVSGPSCAAHSPAPAPSPPHAPAASVSGCVRTLCPSLVTPAGLQCRPWGTLLSLHCPRGLRRGGRLAPGPSVFLRNDSLMRYKWYLLWCLNHSDGKPPHSGEQGGDGADVSASRGECVCQAACGCWPSPAWWAAPGQP